MIKVHNKKLIILPDTTPDTTTGGVALPDLVKDKPTRGKILLMDETLDLNIGDFVTYPSYAAIPIPPNTLGKDLVILSFEEIWFSETV
jgi:co-chaperonin GroES (HSP10)